MKTHQKQSQPVSRTIHSKMEASKQASTQQLLQRYQDKTVQRQELEEDEFLQGKFEETAQRMEEDELDEEELPVQEKSINKTGLPDDLKAGIENLSGYSMDDVRVHYNSGKPAQLQALAYTQGTDIHVAPGQEKHLPHEAWHVVQQKQGRVQPTMQLQGVSVNDEKSLEKEADVKGREVIQQKKSNKTLSGFYRSKISSVLQLATTKYYGINGYSGYDKDTKAKLQKWPAIHEKFNDKVEDKNIEILKSKNPREFSYVKRSKYHCAEPNAFANYLVGKEKVEKTDLENGTFGRVIHEFVIMPTCEVCKQWIEDNKIKPDFIDRLFPDSCDKIIKGKSNAEKSPRPDLSSKEAFPSLDEVYSS